jgi:hypothetical protein
MVIQALNLNEFEPSNSLADPGFSPMVTVVPVSRSATADIPVPSGPEIDSQMATFHTRNRKRIRRIWQAFDNNKKQDQ